MGTSAALGEFPSTLEAVIGLDVFETAGVQERAVEMAEVGAEVDVPASVGELDVVGEPVEEAGLADAGLAPCDRALIRALQSQIAVLQRTLRGGGGGHGDLASLLAGPSDVTARVVGGARGTAPRRRSGGSSRGNRRRRSVPRGN